MGDELYAINQARLRADGVRLKRLAAIGQVVLVVSLIAIPLALYAIARPAVPDVGFWTFLKDLLITGPAALVNAYALIQGVVIFVALGRTRLLGHSLSVDDPLGRGTLKHLKSLSYAMCVVALVTCMSIESVPAVGEPKFKIAISFVPLYFGVMVVTGLTIARRIVSEAVTWKAETQEFI